MKTSTLLLTLCLTSSLTFGQEAAQPQKRNLLSIFRKKPQVQAPAQQQVQAPGAPAATAQPKRGFRLPQFRKPDLSKVRLPKLNVPKLNVPKVSMPKLSMPKWSMPKVSLPKFNRGKGANEGELIQEYPDGIPTHDGLGYFAVVNDKDVKFYELGPSQPFGPDAYLARGDRVTLLSNDRAWARVVLKDGRTGYVGLDQVRFASQDEVPRPPVQRRQPQQDQLVQASSADLEPLAEYEPPTLPAVPESPEAQFNPLLDPLNPDADELIVEEAGPAGVLVDPALDPIGSGPAPFLDDPLLGGVPSIEEELRAIEAASGGAAEDAPAVDSAPEADPDSGESSEES